MKTSMRRAAAVVMAAAAIGVGTASSASATHYAIDGDRAADHGCRADQQVIYHTLIKNGSTAVGYVDLMYSVKCHGAWAHVHGTRVVSNQTWVPHGLIHRNNDGVQYGCTAGEGTQDCWTPMVYDKGLSAYAQGTIDPNGATNTQYTARTPSY
ncbi:DUF2690 domain-containing protein [Angustibacter peucedani]